jgi:hypothetical protein
MDAVLGDNMTPSPATLTRKRKSLLMTQFLLDYQKFTNRRVTVELIRSDEWKQMQAKYIEIFLPLLAEKAAK